MYVRGDFSEAEVLTPRLVIMQTWEVFDYYVRHNQRRPLKAQHVVWLEQTRELLAEPDPTDQAQAEQYVAYWQVMLKLAPYANYLDHAIGKVRYKVNWVNQRLDAMISCQPIEAEELQYLFSFMEEVGQWVDKGYTLGKELSPS